MPPMTNDFIALLKDSSLVSLVTLTELTKTYTNLAERDARPPRARAVVVAVWYLLSACPSRGSPATWSGGSASTSRWRDEPLDVEGLQRRVGARPRLRGLESPGERREARGVLGPSGSGKSTLLRCLVGLETFDAGRVTLGDAGRVSGRSARRCSAASALVFQSLELFPHLTRARELHAGAPSPGRVRAGARGARMAASSSASWTGSTPGRSRSRAASDSAWPSLVRCRAAGGAAVGRADQRARPGAQARGGGPRRCGARPGHPPGRRHPRCRALGGAAATHYRLDGGRLTPVPAGTD